MSITAAALGTVVTSSGTGNAVLTVTGNASVGDLAVATVTSSTNSTPFNGSAVTDSAGNTWNVSPTIDNPGSALQVAIYYSVLTSALTSGSSTIVLASGGVTALLSIYASKFTSTSGWVTPAVDRAAAQPQQTGSTTLTSATTTATTQADDMVYAGWAVGAPATGLAAGAGYTADPNGMGLGPSSKVIFAVYKETVATGAQTATATQSTAVAYEGCIITFKVATSTNDLNIYRIN